MSAWSFCTALSVDRFFLDGDTGSFPVDSCRNLEAHFSNPPSWRSPAKLAPQACRRLSTAYTIGGVLGPYTGGILAGAEGDYYFTARVAAAGSKLCESGAPLFLQNSWV